MIGATAVCKPTTVLVAFNTPVIMTTTVAPTAAGMLTERAEVKTASTDPNLSNNVATTTVDVYRPIALDVSPRNAINEINLGRGGTVSVAIISTGGFDATTVDPSTLCFGDSGAPGDRACAEQHGQGHIEDVNRDGVPDLLLHFSVAATGIDLNDTSACVIGRTFDGVGIYGCDVITIRPQ